MSQHPPSSLPLSPGAQQRATVASDKQTAGEPTLSRDGHLGRVKKYKDICRCYKLTSGPVVPRQVTSAQRSGGRVIQCSHWLMCWRGHDKHLHHFFISLSSSFQHKQHTHTHKHRQHHVSSRCTTPRIKAVHLTKIIMRVRSVGQKRPQLQFTNKPPFPGEELSHSAGVLPHHPHHPGCASPLAAAPGRPRPGSWMSSW